jgi:hypothetical protein
MTASVQFSTRILSWASFLAQNRIAYPRQAQILHAELSVSRTLLKAKERNKIIMPISIVASHHRDTSDDMVHVDGRLLKALWTFLVTAAFDSRGCRITYRSASVSRGV